ncbi:hypothetical protein JTB14_016373 [Gonioctena quinquepunctata]|nr:hypothetical protein JTB14_016373 [Gonioctena quinquepunctata]
MSGKIQKVKANPTTCSLADVFVDDDAATNSDSTIQLVGGSDDSDGDDDNNEEAFELDDDSTDYINEIFREFDDREVN